VPSAGSISTSRSSEALRVPCYVRAKVLAPFRPERSSPSSQDERPPRATACNLGLPRGSPRWHEEDASCRPLQPTHDTSTRGSFDFRARSSRCADAGCFPDPKARFFRAAPDHLAVIQPRLGTRLTARLQLRPVAHGSLCLSARWMPSTALRRRHPGLGVVDHAQSWRTTSDAPCRAPRGHPVTRMTLVRSQDRFRRPFVNEGDFPDPERLPSTSAPEKTRSRDPSCLGEPATDLAALPPAIRLPTLFHPSSALAQKG
jgi:hypothetical protein